MSAFFSSKLLLLLLSLIITLQLCLIKEKSPYLLKLTHTKLLLGHAVQEKRPVECDQHEGLASSTDFIILRDEILLYSSGWPHTEYSPASV